MKASFKIRKTTIQRFKTECRRSGVTMTDTLNHLIEQFVTCRVGMRKFVRAMCARANAAKGGQE